MIPETWRVMQPQDGVQSKGMAESSIDLEPHSLYDEAAFDRTNWTAILGPILVPGITGPLPRGSCVDGDRMDDRWLSVDEIAAYLGIKRDTVYKWIDRKGMPAHKAGRLWKFKKDEVDGWVRSGGSGEKAPQSNPNNKA